MAGTSELAVPVGDIERAELVERPLRAARGLRAGLLVTGLLRIGRWGIGSGRHCLVSVRRGVPAVRILLGQRAARLGYAELVSTAHAAEVAGGVTAGR